MIFRWRTLQKTVLFHSGSWKVSGGFPRSTIPQDHGEPLVIMHDNDRVMTSARAKRAEARLGFTVLPMPPRSPDMMPLDFASWAYWDGQMLESEPAGKEKKEEYVARLVQTAFDTSKGRVDRWMGDLKRRLSLIYAAEGGYIEE